MQKLWLFVALTVATSASNAQNAYQKDFNYFWQTIKDNYAYFDKQTINWDKAKVIYQPMVDTCSSRNSFIHILEQTLNELYNGHNFLNTNTPSSNRLIPSGSDLHIAYTEGFYVIDEVREKYNSDLCGLRKGMRIEKYNDVPIEVAVMKFLPKSTTKYDKEMYEYAANMLLAGTHDTKRKITTSINYFNAKGAQQILKDYFPDSIPNKTEQGYKEVLEYKVTNANVGYIHINNSLGDNGLINAFDKALDSLSNTSALILDLKETPGGGTSTIARAIMGRFIDKEMPYQKHIYSAEERETGIKRVAMEYVEPRKKIYDKQLLVMVGHWTGSMGEGMAIGFDAISDAVIAGNKMAGLLGEIYSFETPELKIPFSFPCVQLQTVDGLPREDYIPQGRGSDKQRALHEQRTDENVLRRMEYDWLMAEFRVDTVTISKMMDESFISIGESGVSNKHQELAGIFRNMQERKMKGHIVDSLYLDDFTVRIYGDVAMVTFVSVTKGVKDKEFFYNRRTRMYDVWIKKKGIWKAVSSQVTPLWKD
jgi:C-terminal processing protease CtpA/Prc